MMTKNLLRAACLCLVGVTLAAHAALVITATVAGGGSSGGGGSPGDPLFFDDFNYAIDREDAGAQAAFVSNGGWDESKTSQDRVDEIGRMYTVTSIPDLSLAWPNGIARALCIEIPESGQSDTYVGLGVSTDIIPADVWFQFWILTAHTATQPSVINYHNKWLYPSNDGYGSHTNRWIMYLGSGNAYPDGPSLPWGQYSDGEMLINVKDWQGPTDFNNGTDYPGDPILEEGAGQTTISEYLVPNRWNLVKLHFDTSHSSTGNKVEAWIRGYGGSWVQVFDFEHGVGGVTFTQSDGGGGHNQLRFPSTIGPAEGTPGVDWREQWHYIQDWAMAASEADLPTYGDEP